METSTFRKKKKKTFQILPKDFAANLSFFSFFKVFWEKKYNKDFFSLFYKNYIYTELHLVKFFKIFSF